MIETARLRLRPGLDRDVKGLVAAMNDWSIAQWLIRPPYPYSEDDARRFIQWTLPKDGVGLGGRMSSPTAIPTSCWASSASSRREKGRSSAIGFAGTLNDAGI